MNRALDQEIYKKVLPKIRGEHVPEVVNALEQLEDVLHASHCNTSADRVQQMQVQFRRTGTTRFWRS